jgi:hypothetical protein
MTVYTDEEIKEQEKAYEETYNASIAIGFDMQYAKECAESEKARIQGIHDATREEDQQYRLVDEVTGRSNSVLNTLGSLILTTFSSDTLRNAPRSRKNHTPAPGTHRNSCGSVVVRTKSAGRNTQGRRRSLPHASGCSTSRYPVRRYKAYGQATRSLQSTKLYVVGAGQ